MPIGPTSGFLDFTNATPRADVIVALSNIGIGTDVPLHALDIRGTANVADIIINNDLTLIGGLTTNTLTINSVSMSTTSNFQQVTNVGNVTTNTVEFTNPTTGLAVTSNAEVGGELSVSGNATVSQELSVSGNVELSSNLTVSGNVEVGTANLFVDTVTGNVGVGTTEPGAVLDVQGSVNLHSLLPSASGGTETQITDDGISYKVHSFTTTGTTQITVSKGGFFECLVVAGGGAGGNQNGSGGGAGGVVIQQVFVNAGTYDVIVGSGNTNGVRNPGFSGIRTYAEYPTGYRGENSSVFGLVAIGGGNGGGDDYCGVDGGSGGGCADDPNVIPGRSVQNQEGSNGYGNRGGYARFNASAGSGGGGAGEPGYDCDPDRFGSDTNSSLELLGRDGGNGVGSTIRTGSIQYYGGGGGGAQRTTAPTDQPGAGVGGKGGGGNGGSANNAGSAGSPNTGGGGGGSSSGSVNGGNGGSGIVVVRYKT